ncbi:hypothetical protein D8674_026801 [Pyrus ussuriensis x Pyrus communis]|uniref:Uncharacterized protein n=1 Tax=Pyrus ussuriensis x Pyrus communis TaxID=2448454 RepID=A0A5N5IAH8_9ROSA|nr:hypothetical protein D8674_026801 [Pyrus ussuriensis x Pyrus communis]
MDPAPPNARTARVPSLLPLHKNSKRNTKTLPNQSPTPSLIGIGDGKHSMETSAVKKPTLNSHSPTFLLHNGFGDEIEISDIEMVTIQTVSYTSLKDLLPASPPLSVMSPIHNSSWHDEIPIKNPLVKHAALAYLQPMSTPPEVGDKGLLRMLGEKCHCELGCLAWVGDVVLKTVRDVFGGVCDRTNRYGEIVDEEDEDDDEEFVKVD